jgi:hypothetical protein
LAADVQLDVGIAHEQGLRVGVDSDELDPFQPGVDHPVDSVNTAAAYAYDLDHRYVVLRCASHRTFPKRLSGPDGSPGIKTFACGLVPYTTLDLN